MIDFLKKQLFTVHQNGKHQVSEVFKYIGPGIIVTVGLTLAIGRLILRPVLVMVTNFYG